MQTIVHTQFAESVIDFVGALDFDARTEGLSPRRLPAWTRPQVPEMMDVIVRMPSGVRLAFETDSRFIELDVQTTRMVTPPASPRPVCFDLVINRESTRSNAYHEGNLIVLDADNPANFKLQRGDPYRVRFDDLPPGNNQVEIWLPHNAFVEMRNIRLEAQAAVRPLKESRPLWLHYGSSISHCMEAESPTGTWPAVAAAQANVALRSFGFAGQCHLDQFVARAIRDLQVDYISLKIGINIINMDSMRERVFPSAVHGFLDTIREKQPTTPILLVSPIYCPAAENHPGPTLPDRSGKFRTYPGSEPLRVGCMNLGRVRELVEGIVSQRRQAGDQNLHYLSGLELFGEKDGADLPDDLHPNPVGYRRMGERFAKKVFGDAGMF